MPSYRIRGSGKNNLRPEREGDYIGFIGCEQVGLLPVRMAADRRVLRVTCPRCGELHMTTDPMPRLRRPGEIVTLVEDGMPMAVVMPADDAQGSAVRGDEPGLASEPLDPEC
jgi:hypothetical protein